MTPEQIKEFLTRLEGAEGCNFRQVHGQITWDCKAGNDKSKSIAILTAMNIPKAEIDEFLRKADELGGHCDCEIVWNAAAHL